MVVSADGAWWTPGTAVCGEKRSRSVCLQQLVKPFAYLAEKPQTTCGSPILTLVAERDDWGTPRFGRATHLELYGNFH